MRKLGMTAIAAALLLALAACQSTAGGPATPSDGGASAKASATGSDAGYVAPAEASGEASAGATPTFEEGAYPSPSE